VIAIEPNGKGLIGTTLRYPCEVQDADKFFDEIEDVTIATRTADAARPRRAARDR